MHFCALVRVLTKQVINSFQIINHLANLNSWRHSVTHAFF
jgi:hypothetical protein